MRGNLTACNFRRAFNVICYSLVFISTFTSWLAAAIEMENVDAIPRIIQEYNNPNYEDLFTVINWSKSGTNETYKTLGLAIVDRITATNKCNDAIVTMLLSAFTEQYKLSSVERDKLYQGIDSTCPNQLLKKAFDSKDKTSVNYVYQYLGSLISDTSNFASDITNKKYKNIEIKSLSRELYGHQSLRALLQTYILKTVADNKANISEKNKQGLAVGFIVLASLYSKHKDKTHKDMVLLNVLPEMQESGFLQPYIYQKDNKVYLY